MKSENNPLSLILNKERAAWFCSAVVGIIFGFVALQFIPAMVWPVPFWMTLPFISLLLAIAIIPVVNPDWWHHNYPNVSLFLAGFIASLYGLGYEVGPHKLLHAAHEYISFLALIGGLFFVASCIRLEVEGKIGPVGNTLLLGFGAVLANVLGTTGASMLLIRPYLRLNHGRIASAHIVFFIIIVSNCGGLLTPIGDPPLYLGYLKGVPFEWTLINLWRSWVFVVSCLLLVFFIFDCFIAKHSKTAIHSSGWFRLRLNGKFGLISLFLMVLAVFIDPLLYKQFGYSGAPFSAIAQLIIAALCFKFTPSEIKDFNQFSFGPFKEVALIFIGIFITMIPALDYLAANGASLGINNAMAFHLGAGGLSAFLDNAPTYLNFLQIALGDNEINPQSISTLIAGEQGNHLLLSISSGAVFFGALTYIGNGPNFMVRSFSESVSVRTPSFLGYFLLASLILGPILVLHAIMFI